MQEVLLVIEVDVSKINLQMYGPNKNIILLFKKNYYQDLWITKWQNSYKMSVSLSVSVKYMCL